MANFWNNFTLGCLILSVGVNALLLYKLLDTRKDIAQINERLLTIATPDQQVLYWETHFAITGTGSGDTTRSCTSTHFLQYDHPPEESTRLQQRGNMKRNIYLYPTGSKKKNQIPNFFRDC